MPRFAMYAVDTEKAIEPEGKATFHINERSNRVISLRFFAFSLKSFFSVINDF